MNTCDTCKWWGDGSQDIIEGAKECGNPHLDPANSGTESNDHLLQVGNDAGWVLNYTQPKFGCVHWEAK